jgi:NADPH:quinone reductase-like Zn-dependent oxidoreductase
MMKAWRLTKPGIDNLELTSIPIPEDIKPYEVAIKLLSSSLNPVDWKKCDWEGGPFKISYPCGCGLDGCGVVVRLGDSVDKAKFEINKTIVFFHGSLANSYGSFAEYTTHDSRYLSIVPQETIEKSQNIQVLAHELSALCCAGFTAY